VNHSNSLNSGLKDYLTEKAKMLLKALVDNGFDEDLAFMFLELNLNEKDFWSTLDE
jgi:hypothetical protein